MKATERYAKAKYTAWAATAMALAIALPGCAPEKDEKLIRMAYVSGPTELLHAAAEVRRSGGKDSSRGRHDDLHCPCARQLAGAIGDHPRLRPPGDTWHSFVMKLDLSVADRCFCPDETRGSNARPGIRHARERRADQRQNKDQFDKSLHRSPRSNLDSRILNLESKIV